MLLERRHHSRNIIAGLCAALALTVLCYWPSLNGPFLFDDIPNLQTIGDRGGLHSFDRYLEFMTSGESGPLGRPLSLASFALNGQDWPADARPFRITNLLIHLVNGVLVFLLARLIFSTAYQRETAAGLALLCAALWLLHPLLVSTTAYIVQRMTQLSTLFTLAGLLCYLHGRAQLARHPQRAWRWFIIGMGSCGALALLSKETGILLPLYALLLELTIFSRSEWSSRQRNALLAILSAPLLATLVVMSLQFASLSANFELRPYSQAERLLTQAPVLMDYLQQVLTPRLSGLGLFHDDFPVSRGLFEPVSTLASFVGIGALLLLALWSRKKLPLLALGVLWFFAGHSLEAGPIALELYFEHRNYLPLLGPLLAICSLLPLITASYRRWLSLGIVLVIGMESFLTWQSATPWGNEEQLMRIALLEHPDSLRAQQYVSNQLIVQGRYEAALKVQENLAVKFPQHTSTRLGMLNLRCILGSLSGEQVAATQRFLVQGHYDAQFAGLLPSLLSNATENTCAALGHDEYQQLLDALLQNPVIGKQATVRGPVHYFKGLAFEAAGNLAMAQQQLDLAYAAEPDLDIRFLQISWALAARDPGAAADYLALAKSHRYAYAWQSALRAADLQELQQIIDRFQPTP